jgi:hypothetical protein
MRAPRKSFVSRQPTSMWCRIVDKHQPLIGGCLTSRNLQRHQITGDPARQREQDRLSR